MPLEPDPADLDLAPVDAEADTRVHLVVAGRRTRLQHDGWLAGSSATWRLDLGGGRHQLLREEAEFATAALVRLARLGPRRHPARTPVPFPAERHPDLVSVDDELRARALAEVDAELAWALTVSRPEGERRLTVVDGAAGVGVADEVGGTVQPASPSFVYRVLSTALLV